MIINNNNILIITLFSGCSRKRVVPRSGVIKTVVKLFKKKKKHIKLFSFGVSQHKFPRSLNLNLIDFFPNRNSLVTQFTCTSCTYTDISSILLYCRLLCKFNSFIRIRLPTFNNLHFV